MINGQETKKYTVTDPIVFAVWQKGNLIPGFDGSIYKTDLDGYIMEYSRYGQERTFGWEIQMIVPESDGGSFSISNLMPVCWENRKNSFAPQIKLAHQKEEEVK